MNSTDNDQLIDDPCADEYVIILKRFAGAKPAVNIDDDERVIRVEYDGDPADLIRAGILTGKTLQAYPRK